MQIDLWWLQSSIPIVQMMEYFAGIAQQRYMAPSNKATTIIGAADVYLSDFGTVSVVPNRFIPADAGDGGEVAFVIDPDSKPPV